MVRGKHPITDANETSPFGNLTAAEFYAAHNVAHSTSAFVNQEGLRIFTQTWLPLDADTRVPLHPSAVKGIVCVVHGYTSESSWLVQLTATLFAEAGFAVCALDHRGHGYSDGLAAHIPDIRPVVDDCIAFFDGFRDGYPPGTPAFLYAESLGGAIALLVHLKQQKESPHERRWAGAVLHCAMCGISDKFKPPWPLEHLLSFAATVMPTWKVVPTKGTIIGVSFKEEWKRKLAAASPNRRMGRPRAATAFELTRICKELQSRFEEVTVPMLIVHGSEDVLCDPAGVEELHRRASSKDKTLRIYQDMWHQVIGESEEDVDRVFGEVLDWVLVRAEAAAAAATTAR